MTESELKSYGWLKEGVTCMCWRDPKAKLSYYTFKDAVTIQQGRLPIPFHQWIEESSK